MTNHTKTYVEHQEIKAVRFDCRECEASVSIPLGINMNFSSVDQCPNCGKPWTSFRQTSINGELKRCAEAIWSARAMIAHQLSNIAEAGFKGFTVSLEIAPPETLTATTIGKD